MESSFDCSETNDPEFFAHDLQKYARLMPEYLAQMYELRTSNPNAWQYFNQGNFSMNKSTCAFSAIGADHGVEQENRALKVLDSVKGLLINKSALHRFSFVSPELNRLCDDFLYLNIEQHKRTQHYQLTGTMNLHIINNIVKLSDMMKTLDVTFNESDVVFNIISKVVLSEKAQNDVLQQPQIGADMYKAFLSERVTGEKSIWGNMKRKLIPFQSTP